MSFKIQNKRLTLTNNYKCELCNKYRKTQKIILDEAPCFACEYCIEELRENCR